MKQASKWHARGACVASIAVVAGASFWCFGRQVPRSQPVTAESEVVAVSPGSLAGPALTLDMAGIKQAGARRLVQAIAQQKALKEEAPAAEVAEPSAPERSLVQITKDAIRNAAIRDFPIHEFPVVFDDLLSRQQKDAGWTDRLIEALNRLPPVGADDTMSVKEATCYETMCRVVTMHANAEDSRDFWSEAGDNAELDGPGQRFTRRVDESTVESVQYLARYGEDAAVYDAVYNRIYELVTSQRYEEIAPTQEQMARVEAQMIKAGRESAI